MKISVQTSTEKAGGKQTTDLLVVPVVEGSKKVSTLVASLDKKYHGVLQDVLKRKEVTGAVGQSALVRLPGSKTVRAVALVGVGDKKELSAESVRQMAGTAMALAKKSKSTDVTVALHDLLAAELDAEMAVQAASEGLHLGFYDFHTYQKKQREAKKESGLKRATILVATAAQERTGKKAARMGEAFAEAVQLTRDMVNTPANDMKPRDIAAIARKLGKQEGVRVRVYKKTEIEKMKMGGLLGVNAGSDEPPFFVHMSYKPAKAKKSIALIGKGIAFDSGGLSLKPSHFMDTMKMDMAGAASVIGVFAAITKVKPNVEVHGVFATTENMISGSSTRPGDVLTAYNGKTIEVKNTDAEGRLILADALSWTEKNIKPDYMIDLATLTGAAIVALGQEYAAYMGSDEKLLTMFEDALATTEEKAWQLPLIKEYNQLLKSPVADISNLANQNWAGSITAGLFLQAFVEKTPWLHVDIAGPAFVEKQILPYAPYGGSGYVVRTLLQLLRNMK